MGYKTITHSDRDESFGQFGGGAWLEDTTLWPRDPDTGALMLPVLMLTDRVLSIPFLAKGMVATVFVSVERSADGFKLSSIRKLTVNQESDVDNLRKGYSKVIMHKRSKEELFPEPVGNYLKSAYVALNEFTDEDDAEELEDDTNGAGMSKLLGRPHWLQDMIPEPPSYYFLAQISEYTIRKVSPQHEGIFGDGMGYLFIDHRAKKLDEGAEAGYFFIQFT